MIGLLNDDGTEEHCSINKLHMNTRITQFIVYFFDTASLNPKPSSIHFSEKYLYQNRFTGLVDKEIILKPKTNVLQHLEYKHSTLSYVPAALTSYCTQLHSPEF